ncbi:MAG: hypothetical protein U0X91_23070 [Spirosomataceae bacterium]
MGKRLIRIFPAQLPARAAEIIHRDVNIVLKSNQTFFGHCLKIENQIIFLKDFRHHRHNIAFSQIESVIYDQSSIF